MFRTAFVALFGLAIATTAVAGPQYIDSTGFAVSGYDVVAYHNLAQSPVGTAQPEGIPGRADITAEYNGSTFAFASDENRQAFLSDPAAYAPQYDGHCAYGVATGSKVPGNPNLWRIVDDKLYLNITDSVAERWEKDIPGYERKAQANWVGLEESEAATSSVPNFEPDAPVTE